MHLRFLGLLLCVYCTVNVISVLHSCGVPIIYTQGYPDFGATVMNCSKWSPSPMNPPSYFENESAVNVYTQLVLNNLISVDDVAQTITFDAKFRLLWYDPRFELNNLIALMNPNAQSYGIEIDDVINAGMEIWRPLIIFPDQISMVQLDTATRIRNNGIIYWSTHYIFTIAQAQLNFREYPMDSQGFRIRWEPYSLPANVVNMTFNTIPFLLYSDIGMYHWKENGIWSYDNAIPDTYIVNYGQGNGYQLFSVCILTINMSRISNGILIRYAIPILLISILGSLLFWADVSSRLSGAVTLLLAESALYIIVCAGIPAVGYILYYYVFIIILKLLSTSNNSTN